MIKWGLVTKFDYIPRYEYLSKYLAEKHNIENEFQVLDCDPSQFLENQTQWEKEFDQLRVGPPFGSILAQNLDQSNALTMTIKTADCLHHVDATWWPRSLLEEAMLRTVVRSGVQLDIHSKAMVIGTGASAKAAIMPLIKLGFNTISFTDSDSDRGYDFVADMRQRIFSANFDFIEQRDIALLPGTYSLVVNTTPDMDDNTLVEDLSYFNYLKSGGVALDLSVKRAETKFVSQAMLVMAQVLPGYQIAADVDSYWAEMCFDIDFDIEDYESGLTEVTEDAEKFAQDTSGGVDSTLDGATDVATQAESGIEAVSGDDLSALLEQDAGSELSDPNSDDTAE